MIILPLLVAVVIFATSAYESPDGKGKQELTGDVEQGLRENCMVKLPGSLQFAGEKVPLGEWDVRERLDREIHVNSYFHSSTFQLLKLANRWFPTIDRILQQNGIPGDFKYIVAVESGFRNVVSPAGARGFWQFMPGTAKEYGLTVNNEVDQRYDVESSTQAACQYLREAYDKFRSWTLAAASYNAGMPNMQDALTQQFADNYYDLHLNEETSRYLFRVLALKLILTDPVKYGFCFEQADLYEPIRFRNVEIGETIQDIGEFAHQHQTSVKEIKNLNPWIRNRTLKLNPGEVFVLKMPA